MQDYPKWKERMKELVKSDFSEAEGIHMDAKWVDANFSEAPQGVSAAVKVTILTALHLNESRKKMMKRSLLANVGCEKVAAASLLTWLAVVDDRVYQWVIDINLHLFPLVRWKEELSDLISQTRLVGMVDIDDDDGHVAFAIRKLLNLCGRNLDEADWEKEAEGVKPEARKRSTLVDFSEGQEEYKEWFHKEANMICGKIVKNLASSTKVRDIATFWETRWAWTPGGSSSSRRRVSGTDDYRIGPGDRPNKKAVSESYTTQEFIGILCRKPITYARCSTKPEPGHKARALYAEDDESALISSYGSQDLEKFSSIEGMVAKQTPNDIAEWIRAHLYRNISHSSIWFSMDYSDFNKEHRQKELAALNYWFARAWERVEGISESVRRWKQYCCLWTAMASFNAWYRTPVQKEYSRMYSGLCSGHRNTARDNTILHYIYSNIAQRKVAADLKYRVDKEVVYICGDDEDGKWSNMVDIIAYGGAHWLTGWHLKEDKQMVGFGHHEYLQRILTPAGLPIRPLIPMICTTTTGNWYKRGGFDYDLHLSAISDNCWEMVTRGGDIGVMRKLCKAVLDHLYTVSIDNKKKKLDWMRYIGSISEYGHPLFGISHNDLVQVQIPDLTTDYNVSQKLPTHGTQDWIDYHWKAICHMEGSQLRRYKEKLSRSSYASLYSSYRNKEKKRRAMDEWIEAGPRTKDVNINQGRSAPIKPDNAYIIRKIGYDGKARRKQSLAECLNGMNLDLDTFNAIGRWKGVAEIHGINMLCKYADFDRIDEDNKRTARSIQGIEWLDSAVQNWLRSE